MLFNMANAVQCKDGTIIIGDGLLKALKSHFPDLTTVPKMEALNYLSTLNSTPK